MKIERTRVLNIEEAIYGMRNPMNSWDKSDSFYNNPERPETFQVGPEDNKLAMKLIRAGTDHRKFMRQIFVSCFITIPRYIWTELDTYKVGTVRNSCSTMHKLGSRPLIPEDFQDAEISLEALYDLNSLGEEYREEKKVDILRVMKQRLPEGYLQSATYTMNYENALNMYHARKNHRMKEWSGPGGICEWIESLPMMKEWLHVQKEN